MIKWKSQFSSDSLTRDFVLFSRNYAAKSVLINAITMARKFAIHANGRNIPVWGYLRVFTVTGATQTLPRDGQTTRKGEERKDDEWVEPG